MAITTYSELLTAVADRWKHRSDLATVAAELVAVGEARLNRLLRARDMEVSATITPSTSVRYVALPTGYLEAISFTDDLGQELQPLSPSELESAAYAQSPLRPRYYRISSRIDFDRIADATYSYTLRHYKRLDIATDLTNSILTNNPDVYLYSALVAAEKYVQNDARIAMWKSELNETIVEINAQQNKDLKQLRTDFGTVNNFNIYSG